GYHSAAGQIVARLDDTNTRAALNVAIAQQKLAQAALDNAVPIYERYKKLYAENATTQDALQAQKTQYDSARMNLDVAQAAVAAAIISENDMVVRAPFAGVVTQKDAQVGEIVVPSAGGGSGGAHPGHAPSGAQC